MHLGSQGAAARGDKRAVIIIVVVVVVVVEEAPQGRGGWERERERSFDLSFDRSIYHSIVRSIIRSFDLSFDRSIYHSIVRSIYLYITASPHPRLESQENHLGLCPHPRTQLSESDVHLCAMNAAWLSRADPIRDLDTPIFKAGIKADGIVYLDKGSPPPPDQIKVQLYRYDVAAQTESDAMETQHVGIPGTRIV